MKGNLWMEIRSSIMTSAGSVCITVSRAFGAGLCGVSQQKKVGSQHLTFFKCEDAERVNKKSCNANL